MNQFSSLQLPQQLQSQAITPQHNLQATPSSIHQQMVSPTPVHIQTSTLNQYPQQTPAQQILLSTSAAFPPYMPPATMSTSQQGALFPPSTSQLKKVKFSERALSSGAIQESLDDINDAIARYPSLKGAKLPTLAQNLAKEAVLGENILKQCTPHGSRNLPCLPIAKLQPERDYFPIQPTIIFWGNTATAQNHKIPLTNLYFVFGFTSRRMNSFNSY